MRRLQLLALFTALLFSAPALSQTNTIVNFKNGTNSTQVSAANPLPITGSFSAGTFAPGGAYATLTATASSADAALPAGTSVIAFNTGTTAVSCSLSVGAGTALASQNIIQASSWLGLVVGSNTHIACIDQTGSASNLVVVSGGSGSPSGAGGGGGGGGAVTLASGAVSSGAYSSGSIASGAYASGAFASGAAASGSWSDGSIVTLGAKADTACATAPCSTNGWLAQVHSDLGTLNTTAGNPIAAGTNLMGKVGIDQTTPGTTNAVSTQLGGVATVDSPCQTVAHSRATFTITSAVSTKVIAGTAAKKTYICAFDIVAYGAQTVGVVEGTKVTNECDTGASGVFGDGTAAHGISLPANGNGLVRGNGQGTVWNTTVNADDFCLITSTTAVTTGQVQYVQK